MLTNINEYFTWRFHMTIKKTNKNTHMKISCKNLVTLLICCFFYSSAYTSNDKSLKETIHNCKAIMDYNPDSAYHILRAINISKDNKFYPHLLILLGDYYRINGSYDSSYVKYFEVLGIVEKNQNINLIAEVKINMGILYDLQHDQKNAIKMYKQALSSYNTINDTIGLIKAYMNLGISFKNIGLSSNNNATIDSAFIYYNNAEVLLSKVDNLIGLTKLYINIGNLKYTQQQYIKAIFYYKKALKIAESNNFYHELALIYDNLGWAYQSLNNNETALNYALKGLEIGRKINSKYNISNSLSNISGIYKNLNNYYEAYNYLNQQILINDSLINESTIELQNKLQSKYESEKKDNEIALLNTQKEKNATIALAEQKKKNIIIISVTSGLGLLLLFSLFIFNRLKITRKQKKVIEEQKQEVEYQKEIVEKAHHNLEEKNKEITDSINYAKRIQNAILPSRYSLTENLKNGFVFFKPKDIVSGDFYWLEAPTPPKGELEGAIFFAAADCTGHGVPGAMVSVMCSNALSKSLIEENITEPGKLLDKTSELIVQRFSKSDEDVKDGMDIALCSIKYKVESKKLQTTAILQYAGANNPLWIVRPTSKNLEHQTSNFEFIEIKPNKQPIGKVDNPQPFTTHTIELQQGDTFYIFTDGFADQFGGEKGKKMMYKPFKELLVSIQDKTMDEQKVILEEHFENWKGSLEQVDDVCVIGVRI